MLRPLSAAAVAGILGAASALPHGHPRPGTSYPDRPGFTLWLVEEFDEPMDLDTDPIWTWSDGGLFEGQVRFVKEGVRFEDGLMKIVAAANPQPGSCSNAEVAQVRAKALSSGEMRTRYNMFRYGYYEARMRAPSIQPGNYTINGNYISTLFVYRDAKFRHWREIDIEVTGNTANSVTMNVLNADYTDRWNPSIQATQQYQADGENVREDFHVFAFEWLPSGITWYLDGNVIGTHRPGNRLRIPDLSTKIIMNLWIFSDLWDFGGREGYNNRYPMHSEYDWFRFYKWNGDNRYPCTGTEPSCLTEDDRYFSSNNGCDGIPQSGGNPPCLATCARAKNDILYP